MYHFTHVAQFAGLRSNPFKGQLEISCWFNQSSYYSWGASKGKGKVKQKKNKNFYDFISCSWDSVNILFFFFLFKSVATIGSTLTSVQHDVKSMQSALENQKKDENLEKTMVNAPWTFPDSWYGYWMAIGHECLKTPPGFQVLCVSPCFLWYYSVGFHLHNFHVLYLFFTCYCYCMHFYMFG